MVWCGDKIWSSLVCMIVRDLIIGSSWIFSMLFWKHIEALKNFWIKKLDVQIFSIGESKVIDINEEYFDLQLTFTSMCP